MITWDMGFPFRIVVFFMEVPYVTVKMDYFILIIGKINFLNLD